MRGFTIEGTFSAGVPMVKFNLVTQAEPPDDEEKMYFPLTGIIDTGCPTCIVNVGVLPDYFFDESVPPADFWSFSGLFDGCRGATMGIWFEGRWKDAFPVPVFEQKIGRYEPGDAVMLIGRSLLNFGTFIYDGPNQEWHWTYETE